MAHAAQSNGFPVDIALVVFDFDGVMTDNTVKVFADGNEYVEVNRSDGLGIDSLRKAGVPMMVLSTEQHPVVAARCAKLRLPCHQGIADKLEFLKEYLKNEGIAPEHVAYLGNDINDLACLSFVGFGVVVADAHQDVLPAADVVLTQKGGKGAVREFCDKLLAARHS
ncbi:HAD hydrolase family protein [Candidatus Peregrinibacteria bacterium]|nr:HAD hydrolase family protein [Candidatus Peregrinibacteria bacterium]